MDGASRVCPGGAGLLARQEGCVMLASVGAVRRTSSAPGGELSEFGSSQWWWGEAGQKIMSKKTDPWKLLLGPKFGSLGAHP